MSSSKQENKLQEEISQVEKMVAEVAVSLEPVVNVCEKVAEIVIDAVAPQDAKIIDMVENITMKVESIGK